MVTGAVDRRVNTLLSAEEPGCGKTAPTDRLTVTADVTDEERVREADETGDDGGDGVGG